MTLRPLLLVLVLSALAAALPACGKDESPAPDRPATSPYGGGTTPAGEETSAGGGAAPAAAPASNPQDQAAKIDAALAKGGAFLRAAQSSEGRVGDAEAGIPPNLGYTALGALGMIATTPRSAVRDDEAIHRALSNLAAAQVESGAIVDPDLPQVVNYVTSVSVGAFAAARISDFAQAEAKARDYLAASQIRGDVSDPSYGGMPYKQESEGQPADLSNLQMAAQALHDSSLPQDHPFWEAMQVYLKRVQNSGEVNTYAATATREGQEIEIVAGNDGGGVYAPGSSKVEGLVQRSDGKWELRSYGSMTYALLKCLIFAGVDPQDRRVQMAADWIASHWTLERNPGFENEENPDVAGQQGYYYYLYTAARALAAYEEALGEPLQIQDANGRSHDWRRELAEKLLALQSEDGSWRNDKSDRWQENSKVLCTSYAVQALAVLTGRI